MTKTTCFWCGSGPLKRPIVKIPLTFPNGNQVMVPICKKCSQILCEIEVQVENNPHLKVYYIPVFKAK
jgi:hypothetical protein